MAQDFSEFLAPNEHLILSENDTTQDTEALEVSQATSDDLQPIDADSGTVDPATPVQRQEIVAADGDNIVRLPAETSLENVELSGEDLLLRQPDGFVITVQNGAANAPTFFIGDVEVPSTILVAALNAVGLNVAAGPNGALSIVSGVGSSGGNFVQDVPDIGEAGPVLELLPYTELVFPQFEREELFEIIDEDDPVDDIPVVGVAAGTTAFALLDESDGTGTGNDGVSVYTIDAATVATLFITPDFGANGPGSITYALTGVDGAGTGLFLTDSTVEITLNVISPTQINAVSGTTIVFEVIIEPASGEITITQHATLDHSETDDHDDVVMPNNVISIVQTAIDADGDTASATSGNALSISFEDDGPVAVAVTGATASAQLDESNGTGSGTDGSPAGSVTITGVATSLFATPAYGADGAGSTAYTLSATDNAQTGLFLTGSTTEILLVKASDTVYEGREGGGTGTLAFTVSIDGATGDVTVTQHATLDHPDTADHDDDVTLAAAADISVVQTITDGDGDTATATSANALDITFEDDGPKATATATATASAQLDESNGTGSGTDGSPAGSVTITGVATSLFATPAYGADGAGSTAYTLSATDNAQTGLFLTGSTTEILLVKASDTVYEGREGGGTGTLAFTVSIDGATGDVTVTQHATLDHPDTADHDDDVTLAAAADISVVQTITDGDGDTATATSANALDITFEDDGPKATATATATASAQLDESNGTGSGTDGSPAGSVTITGVATSLFATPAYGADGAGSTAYTLSATDNAQTGLFLTGSTTEILLVKASDTVYEGREGGGTGTLAFTVSIDGATGDVTVTQHATLDHPDTADHDDDVTLAAAADISVVQTITDGDGDTATATSANALDITFEDDGPKATATATATASAQLDESNGTGSGTDGSPAGSVTITGVATSLFATPAYGADGAGSTAYTLSATDNAQTGLFLTGSTTEILLVKASDTVYEGREGGGTGTLAFTVSIDGATGDVTVTQHATLDHPDTADHDDDVTLAAAADISVVQTITDGDGDTATATSANALDITFEDDGPKATATATATASAQLDESNGTGSGTDGSPAGSVTITGVATSLFATPAYGADGAGSTAYTLSATDNAQTGLFLTGSTTEILLVKASDTVYEGREGGGTGTLAFTVSIDGATGDVTVTQHATLDHPDTADHDDDVTLAAAADISVVQTITDGDGDTATATSANALDITFEDDGPKATATATATASAQLDESNGTGSGTDGSPAGSVTITGVATSLFATPAYGADGAGSTAYTLSATDNAQTGLFLTGSTTEILLVKASDTVYEGREGGGTGTLAFTVSIDGATGDVTVTQHATLDHPDTADHDDDVTLAAAADISVVQTITDGDGDTATATSANALDITFEDDGPKATATATATASAQLDESNGTGSGTDGSPAGSVTITGVATSLFATPAYGADGAGSTAYTLSATDNAQTGLFLTGSTTEILLVKASDTVYEGREGGGTGTLAFTVSIDGATGDVTVTQHATLDHPDTADHDDDVTLAAAADISVVQTITDGDGDTATATSANALDITFEDDGPKATATATATASAQLDESNGTGSGTDGSPAGSVTITGVATSLFATPAYGADGAGSTAYTLSATDNAQTGLFLTGSTTEILLVKASDTVYEGREGGGTGTLAFTVSIDGATGDVTVTQHATLDHPDTADHDDDVTLAAAADISVVQTITDGDGDTATATSANALDITFEDDGPKATATATATASAQLDESNGTGSGTDGSPAGSVTITGVATSLFATPAYGADGAGSTAYTLSATDNAQTGLFLTGSTTEILLVKASDTVYEGREGGGTGTLAFTVSIDGATGDVTVTQHATLDHPDTADHDDDVTLAAAADISVVQTITDGDGDTATATSANALDITFEDDGPKATATATATASAQLDESNGTGSGTDGSPAGSVTITGVATSLFATPAYGADGAGSTAYTLSATDNAQTGLFLTGSTTEILLVKASDTVYEGREGGGTGTLAFTVSIDGATGDVTVTQHATLDHPDTADHDDDVTLAAAADISVVQTITDGDGDTATATSANALDITFEDDGPKATATATATASAQLDESNGTGSGTDGSPAGSVTITGVATSLFATPAYGADGAGSTAYTLSATDNAQTGLFLTGSTTEILLVKASDTVYEGREGGGTGTLAFTVSIDGATGDVTVTQHATLDHPDTADHDDDVTLAAAADISVVQTITDGDGDTATATSANALDITFEDDGPKATATATATASAQLDESNGTGSGTDGSPAGSVTITGVATSLFATPAYGADGAGSTAYTLSATDNAQTGLFLTGSTTEILLVKASDTVYEGREGGGTGTLAFTVSIDGATGDVTVTQHATLDHPDTADHDDDVTLAAAADISVVQTITDGDGDTATATSANALDITFEDDGPKATATATATASAQLDESNGTGSGTDGSPAGSVTITGVATSLFATPAYGADGAGSTAYTLSATDNAQTGLFLTGSTTEILLVKASDTVYEGREGGGTGTLAFTVSIDGATGDVTVTQHATLDHPDTADHDDDVTLAAAADISVVQTITDGDGDTATATSANALDITFEDDGPKATATATATASAQLDESNGTGSGTDGSPAGSVTITGVATSLFATPAYGADGAGSTAYTLSATDNAQTGLFLTGSTTEILLVKASDTVYEGREGGGTGTLAFTVSIDGATGDVTVTQHATLDHPDTADHDDDVTLAAAADISVVQTITDGDGDTATATSANALDITFEDDGPKATATATATASAQLDESNGTGSGTDGSPAGSVTITGVATSLFATPAYGADGAGSTAYTLSATDNAQTGLFLTGSTTEILLVKASDTVYEGREGGGTGTLAFTVSIDGATGDVTVTQHATLDHPDTADHDDDVTLAAAADISVVQTITDGDGDTATATSANALDITFEDDGPKATATATATASAQLDESNGTGSGTDGSPAGSVTITGVATSLFATPAYGADGAGSTAYTLSATDNAQTGLFLTGSTTEILLVKASDTVYEGREGGGTGTLAFTVSIDGATGDVTVTQHATLDHPDTADHDDDVTLAAAADISVVQTITDGDGDTATATSANALDITFEDDGPKATATATATASAQLDESNGTGSGTDGSPAGSVTITGVATSLFATPAYGADGAGSTAYTLSATDNAQTGLFLTGSTTEILLVKASDTVYEGREGGGTGTLAFTVSIDGATGDVTVTQHATLDHPDTADHDDDVTLAAAADISVVQTITDGDGDTATATSANALDITFEDDGPKATATATATASAQLDESNGTGSGTDGSPAGSVTITGVATSLFATPAYGADGAGSTAYTLSATDNAQTGLFLTGSTTEILLVKASDTVYEGREGGGTGTLAFTVSIDGATGDVTVTQHATLDHPDTADHDDDVTLAAAADISVVQTITDGDGDTATATSANALDITFEDDGPKATATATATASAQLDESNGTGSGTDGSPAGSVTITGVATSLFATPAYGADGAGSTAYTLSATDNAQTGLFLTGSTTEILLVKASDTVYEGREGGGTGTLAFTVSIDGATGDVTVTQHATLDHPDTADHDDDVTLAAAADISVVQTITDGDGDTATATSANALDITFEDDGPKATATATATASAQLDESNGTGSGTDGSPAGSVTITGVATSLFATPAYGADGAGSTAYTLSATDNAQTGLFLTGSTTEILLVKASDTVYEGREGGGTGTLAFTVSIDGATGDVTVTQHATLDHPDTADHDDDVTLAAAADISVVQTITDGDGDTATATSANALDITFEDDGPANNANEVNALVHEDALDNYSSGSLPIEGSDGNPEGGGQTRTATFTYAAIMGLVNFGADGAGAVELNTATLDGTIITGVTSQGETLEWNVNAGTIEGISTVDGRLIFTVTHDDNSTPLNSGDDTYTFTLIDQVDHLTALGDGDASVEIDIAPAFIAFDGDGDSVVLDSGLVVKIENDVPVISGVTGGEAQNNGGTVGNLYVENSVGEIDSGSTTGSVGADEVGVYSITDATGTAGTDYTISANGTLVTGYYDSDDDGTIETNGDDDAYYEFEIDPNSGDYSFELLAEAPNTIVDPDLTNAPSPGSPVPEIVYAAPGYSLTISAEIGDELSVSNAGTGGPKFGVNDNNIDKDDFVTAAVTNVAGDPVCLGALSFEAFVTNDPIVTWTATLENGTTATGTLALDSGDGIYTVDVFAATGQCFTSIDIGLAATNNGNNDKFKFGLDGFSFELPPNDTELAFDIALTDADGDVDEYDEPGDLDGDGDADSVQVYIERDGDPTTAPPVILDLDGDGVESINLSDSTVAFDYDGDGTLETTAWVGADDGLLAIDLNGDGIVNDGSEIVFAQYAEGAETDLEGLAGAFDTNHDGKLTEADDQFEKFGVWVDADSDGVTDEGEFSTLIDFGITEIELVSDGIQSISEDGSVTSFGTSQYTMSDGSTGAVGDVAFTYTDDAANTFVMDEEAAAELLEEYQASINEIDLSEILASATGSETDAPPTIEATEASVSGDVPNIDEAAVTAPSLTAETIKILFDDSAAGNGTDIV